MSINTRIKLKRDTTAGWDAARGFVPLQGEVIIYLDGSWIERDGQKINVPMIKIGDGHAYVQDLPFVDEDLRIKLLAHVDASLLHVSEEDRQFWNHKIYYMVNQKMKC